MIDNGPPYINQMKALFDTFFSIMEEMEGADYEEVRQYIFSKERLDVNLENIGNQEGGKP